MPIDVGVPTSAVISEQLEFIERAEELGFAGAGTADHLRYGQDAFLILGAAAARTNRITLYPAVTNPVVRSPAILAGLANSLGQLAPGRTKLVIGAGDQSAVEAGVKPATLSQFKEAVVVVGEWQGAEFLTLFGRYQLPSWTVRCTVDQPIDTEARCLSPTRLSQVTNHLDT